MVSVYDGTTWRLYRNGTEVCNSVTANGSSNAIGANWAIGARGDGTSRWFDGKIDDVRIYNRGLSANEVSALYSYGYTTGSTVVYSLGGTSAVSGTLKIDSGILDANASANSITGATTINGGGYNQINRFWEASPPDIAEAAVDEIGNFMLHPEIAAEVQTNLQALADKYWSSHK